MCVLWCFTRVLLLTKHLSHWLHWYGFSPVCVLWCCNGCIVCSQVIFKITAHWESFVTMAALIWFIPSVCFQMAQKMTVSWESLITITAMEWFHQSVCVQVAYKITIMWESLITLAALIQFLLCMYYLFFYQTFWNIMFRCEIHVIKISFAMFPKLYFIKENVHKVTLSCTMHFQRLHMDCYSCKHTAYWRLIFIANCQMSHIVILHHWIINYQA